ncbi:MAG: hypothetical protein HYY03_04885 [Chloroflexi bacterium]|nr:hypothetical protein [Chloroflexota bacterium]
MNEAQEWARIALDFWWPGLVILLAFLVFHRPIAEFIADIEEIVFPGVRARRRPQLRAQQEEPPKPGNSPPTPAEQPPKPPDSAGQATVEQLQPFVYYWYYEKMYRVLFGTQLAFLQYVNTHPGATVDDALPFYRDHERLARPLSQGFQPRYENWIGFLISTGFLTQPDGRFYVTDLGKSFRQWMVAENLGDKPGL